MMYLSSRPCSEMTMTNPSPYTQRAENHWRDFRPADYEKIPPQERVAFFARLGAEIEERVTARAQQLIDRNEPDQPVGYLQRLALMNTLRHEAEQQVLDEMLPAPQEAEEPASSYTGSPSPAKAI